LRAHRQRLAAAWLADAVEARGLAASHARLARALRALGAPVALWRAAHWAVADAAAHAARCQAMANAFAGRELRAEPPDGDRATRDDLRATALRAVADGCVRCSVTAAVAAEAAARCEDPAVEAVLQRAASDATRHAGMAWRVVRWALRTDPTLVGPVTATLAEVRAVEHRGRAARVLERHGQLGPSTRAAIAARVLREVVRPCAAALLERVTAARHG
jgi:hypothetical protein